MKDQFLDYRNCADVAVDLTKEYAVGLMQDVFDCESVIRWYYESDGDMKVQTYDPSTISIDRAEKVSDLPLKQTVANDNSLEWTMDIEFEFNSNHPFIQAMSDIFKNEYYTEDKGKGLIALSNGGVWFMEKSIYNKGKTNEYVEMVVYPHLKISEISVPFSGKITSETTYTMSLLVENYPIIKEEGIKPAGYGIPNGITAPEVTFNSLTGSVLSFDYVDEENIIYTNADGDLKVFYELYDITDTEADPINLVNEVLFVSPTTGSFEVNINYTPTGSEKLVVKFGVFLSETLRTYLDDFYSETGTSEKPTFLKVPSELSKIEEI